MDKRIKAVEDIVFKGNKKMVRKFKFHHKAIFAFIVFVGAVFLWYGVWTIISNIAIANNPYVATVIGLVILLATGMYYDNTL